ncbi:hypothetical protein VTK73DRAFT_7388 [Phialemonium thermophilum]|uniref:Uncharacterized protein n=1 Tax=Phialemonium thermophilum TaxID=223376 RepID=A0ABR3WEU0_9PEZI
MRPGSTAASSRAGREQTRARVSRSTHALGRGYHQLLSPPTRPFCWGGVQIRRDDVARDDGLRGDGAQQVERDHEPGAHELGVLVPVLELGWSDLSVFICVFFESVLDFFLDFSLDFFNFFLDSSSQPPSLSTMLPSSSSVEPSGSIETRPPGQ